MLLQKVLFFGVSSLLSASLCAMTLNEALVLSLENNPAVVERIKNFNAVRQSVKVAQSGYYPHIDLQAGIGYEDISNVNTGFQKRDDGVYAGALEIRQNLFNGFETAHAVTTAQERVKAAAYSYVQVLNSAAYELVQNYLDVIKYRELLQLCVESIEEYRTIAAQVAKAYRDNDVMYASVQKSEASLALARADYYAVSRRYKEAQHRLKKSMGWNVDPKTLEVPKQRVKLPEVRENALQYAIQNSPLIDEAEAKLHAAQEAYKQTQGAWLPKLDATVSQEFNGNRNGVVGDEENLRAMVMLSYNFYRGGADSALQQQRISRMSQELTRQNDLKRQVMERFDSAWSGVEALSKQLQHLKRFETYARESYALYQKEYRQTQHGFLDLVTAYNDLLKARQERTALTYELLQERYRVLDVMGTMLKEILGDTEALYSKVGIAQEGTTEDTLPLHFDSDADGYRDSEDLCQNSVSSQPVNRYGCSDNLHVKEEPFIVQLMQYEKVPQQRSVSTMQPVADTLTPIAVEEKAPTKELDISKPSAPKTPLEGHVIILGSYRTKASAEADAMQFYDIEHALVVVEATKRRYNLKLVLTSRPEALELLTKVRVRVPDAWYAGIQRIVSYSVLSR